MELNNKQLKQYNRIIEILKQKKLRLTNIRCETIKVILSLDHPTATDIIKELEKEYNNVNVMSIYNTLDLLIECELLFANTFNGKQIRYEIMTQKSLHLKCDHCGNVVHIKDDELNSIDLSTVEQIAKNNNIEIDHFKMEAHGTCEKCFKK